MYYTYCLYIFIQNLFYYAWDRASEKKTDGEIRKQKLNEMGTLNMKQKKWNKLDKSKTHFRFLTSITAV